MARQTGRPEIVLVEHDAREALVRMDQKGMNHLCVVDGDVVIGVLSRSRLNEALEEEENLQIHDVMERKVLVYAESVDRKTVIRSLREIDAPYALLVDDEKQIAGLVEREEDHASSARAGADWKDIQPPSGGRIIDLSSDMQAGAAGEMLKAYSARPHIEEEQD